MKLRLRLPNYQLNLTQWYLTLGTQGAQKTTLRLEENISFIHYVKDKMNVGTSYPNLCPWQIDTSFQGYGLFNYNNETTAKTVYQSPENSVSKPPKQCIKASKLCYGFGSDGLILSC